MKKDACDWLREYLRDGPKEVGEIRLAAKAAGYTKGNLRDAKLICGVQVSNNWSRFSQPTADEWYWSLPEDKV